MKKLIKRIELLAMLRAFESLGSLTGIKFAYGIMKNRERLAVEAEALTKLGMNRPEGFEKFDSKRLALCVKHCVRDDSGRPIIEAGSYKGLDDNEDFLAELEELKAKHPDTMAEQEKMAQEYNSFLKEEIEFEFFGIQMDDVPEDISVEQMAVISILLIDEQPGGE